MSTATTRPTRHAAALTLDASVGHAYTSEYLELTIRGNAVTSTTNGLNARSGVRLSPPRRGGATASFDAPVHRLPIVVRALKAMAHPARLRMLGMLTTGELCVCQMTAVLDFAASTVSGHLADLRAAGLVTERKDGKWVHYRLADDPKTMAVIHDVLALLATDHQADTDAAVVSQVRGIPVETVSHGGFDLAEAARRGQPRGRRGTPSRRTTTRRAPAV